MYKEYIVPLREEENDCGLMVNAVIRVQPELIRCVNCKYSDDMAIADGRYWCNYHNGYFKFCSEGERKEE